MVQTLYQEVNFDHFKCQ